MTYETRHQGSHLAGIDYYQCPHCPYETPSKNGMDIHVANFHPEEKKLTKADMVELAKANNIDHRGNKPQIAERLQREGIL